MMTAQIFQELFVMQSAIADASNRLEDKTIGISIKDGRVQVRCCTFDAKGISTITPLSDWISVKDAVTFLNQMS